ncbi:tRNA-uridine aminocarboxypropyltransferase [Anaeromyxobacter sp. SG17]|uniref:tRNA-uridine aminocarboxypropyltransferase n=1 Tax=Anaeromyxobacter sp. SG17 TaxID=2925405 RepID=UPI001F571A60|nr:tRNA-uridine aminocarboxypropyltransferase [Anaeromyxobacter sp. SG17]
MRPTCRRCLRPTELCACADLPVIPSRTRVVLLQHPREARLAICSAWLTRLALENCELHRGVAFEEHPAVRAAAATPGAALLFPGDGAVPAEALAGAPPPVLFAVDGTWPQAVKMIRATPTLAALPRVGIVPARPSGYGGLRREPGPEHLSTAEAVALALGALEGAPARFEPLVRAFRASVEKQLACARGERRSPRHRPGSRWAGSG